MRSCLVVALLVAVACGDSSGPGLRYTLDITPDSVQFPRNSQMPLSVTVLDDSGRLVTGVAVSFTSADTTIAIVTNLGVVHSRMILGRTTVRVSGAGVHTDVPVAVVPVPSGVTLAPTDTTVFAPDTVQYRATVLDEFGAPIQGGLVTWQSFDTSIATVTSSGEARATGKGGVATISAGSGIFGVGVTLRAIDSLIIGRTALASRPYAAALSANNVAYVGQLDAASIARANLPSHTFGSGVGVGTFPTEIAFNSTGSRAYVTNQGSSTISVVDVASNTQVDVIAVGLRPFEVIVAPGDSILYVMKVDSVYGIRLATNEIVVRFAIPEVGNGVAIARDTLLYISTHNAGTVIEFNLRTRSLGRTFAVGGVPQKLAVSLDGSELYITNEGGYVQFWSLNSGLQIGSPLFLVGIGYGMARRSTNGLLYVTGGSYLYVVNPVTRTPGSVRLDWWHRAAHRFHS